MRSTATPALVTSAGDDTASRVMSVISSVSELARVPTNVCVDNVGGYQSQKRQTKMKWMFARQQ